MGEIRENPGRPDRRSAEKTAAKPDSTTRLSRQPLRVGILALQGAVEKHAGHLELLGAEPRAVLLPGDLEGLDAIILPGGESTTMSRLLRTSGLFDPLAHFMRRKPVLATCAGMILLARDVDDLPYPPFGLMDIDVSRNAWGRQIFSFQEQIDWDLPPVDCEQTPERPQATGRSQEPGGSIAPVNLKAIFIRAPRLTRVGEGIEVLATLKGEPVAVRQGDLVALTFHPELTGDSRVHGWFLDKICNSGATASGDLSSPSEPPRPENIIMEFE
jgi:pyridoxal 5'-phosphate synthase pdxT subunit